jgi:hypothetical protein
MITQGYDRAKLQDKYYLITTGEPDIRLLAALGWTPERFIKILRALVPLSLDERTTGSFPAISSTAETSMALSHVQDALRMICDNAELLSPFQRLLPSVQKLYDVGGPLDKDNKGTRLGLWNVILFRTVTFASTFSKEDGRMFQSLEDWTSFFDEHDIKYFGGRSCITGDINTKLRSLWNATDDSIIFDWLTSPDRSSYIDCRDKLREALEISEARAHNVVMDYVHAGSVAPPWPCDIANLAALANSTGAFGSEWARLSRKQSHGAFQYLCFHVESVLSSQEKEAIHFDPSLVFDALKKIALLTGAIRKATGEVEVLAW